MRWIRNNPKQSNILFVLCVIWIVYSLIWFYPQGVLLSLELFSTIMCGLYMGLWVQVQAKKLKQRS